MTSLPRQVRLQAFTAGCTAAAGLYVYTKKQLLDVTQDTLAQLPGAPPPKPAEAPQEAELPLTATASAWTVRKWNEGVDAVFKPVVSALARRNL